MTTVALPAFEAPPVAEVVLAVRFESLESFRAAHIGRFWSVLPDFTETEDHAELNLTIEKLGPSIPPVPSFELIETPRFRSWLKTPDGTRIVQIQHNSFVYNWRRAETQGPYPHYDAVRAEFRETFGKFLAFTENEGLGKVKPVQCEVSYVNHVQKSHARIADVVNLWQASSGMSFLPSQEDARFSTRYVIPDPDGSGGLLGRLIVSLQPAFLKASGGQVLNLSLVARGRPMAQKDLPEDILAFFDLAHEWIVRGFTEVTTAEMHKVWGRTK